MKLKPSILDYILLRGKRFDRVISLRNEISYLLGLWNELDILIRIEYDDEYDIITTLENYNLFKFNEMRCYKDNGLGYVVNRLLKDRDRIISTLLCVNEVEPTLRGYLRSKSLEELGL